MNAHKSEREKKRFMGNKGLKESFSNECGRLMCSDSV